MDIEDIHELGLRLKYLIANLLTRTLDVKHL
jgi:hypothetical protein